MHGYGRLPVTHDWFIYGKDGEVVVVVKDAPFAENLVSLIQYAPFLLNEIAMPADVRNQMFLDQTKHSGDPDGIL
jgi:hypothetical protein